MLRDEELERSSVVANRAMNRERGLTGANSYHQDLGVDVVALIEDGLARSGAFRWLDLCCGSGRALIEASRLFDDRVRLVGVDLVDFFAPAPSDRPELLTGSVTSWRPEGTFDLITCVHGLHYVGDKLGVITRAVSWLRPDGSSSRTSTRRVCGRPTAPRWAGGSPRRCARPGSTTTPAADGCPARVRGRRACRSTTWAPTTWRA